MFKNLYIPEANDYMPEVLEYTYLNMELDLLKYGESPKFSKVIKRLHDANGIPIGVAQDNPLFDTIIYEVEYMNLQKYALSTNTITTNIFSQVDEEGNQYDLLDAIVDHCTDGSKVMPDNTFIK